MKLHHFGLILVLMLTFCGCTPVKNTEYTVKDGFWDLSNHDFSTQPIINLGGTWLLYPDELLTPETLANRKDGPSPIPIQVPGLWRNQDFGGKKGPIFGKGTYVLVVKLPKNSPDLMLQFENFVYSSFIYLNDTGFGEGLILDPEKEQLVKPNNPQYYSLPKDTINLQILLQGSNYWDSFGIGFLATPRLGTAAILNTLHGIGISYESFLVGLFFLAALYHFMLFLIQRRDKALLVFSLLMLDDAFRQLSISEKYWLTLLGFSYSGLRIIENGSVYIACILLIVYFSLLYPRQKMRSFNFILLVSGSILFIISTFSPTRIYSSTLIYMDIYIIASAIYCFLIITRAIIQRVKYAGLMLIGFTLLFIATVSDILKTYLAAGNYIMPVTLIPFIIAQSYVLAKRYTRDTEEAEKLRVSTARLTELDRVKTNFMANISHELRTPITLIKAPVEGIIAGEYGETVPKNHAVFGLVQNNINRLLRLVENLLSLTRLESGTAYDLQPTDLGALVPAYLDEFKLLAGKAGITLELENICAAQDIAPVAEIDPKAFEIIFFNLMSNALKFTPAGGRVTVRLESSADGRTPSIHLSVIDNGIGIKDADLATLFVRYQKIYDGERHHYEGNGIGLSLSKETAKAMGGDISVRSTAGKGSVFTLELPLSAKKAVLGVRPQPGQAKPVYLHGDNPQLGEIFRPGKKSQHASRILVVEDHAEMRQFISDHLGTEHEIIQACDGLEAKDLLETIAAPDLIVSDIMMPRLDGVGLFGFTRTHATLASVPFMFLTARDESEEKIRLLRGGCIDFMVKPFSVEELRAKVSAVLAMRNNERNILLRRVQSAIDGTISFPPVPDVSGSLYNSGVGSENRYPKDLTVREVEILKKVVSGATDKEIAEHFGIAQRTASNHVGSILKKTGLSSRQSLMVTYGV